MVRAEERAPHSSSAGAATVGRPDFIIGGVRKSATTSLFRWLEQQPEIWLPREKEPGFFAYPREWARGLDWYLALFRSAGPDQLTGEASVAYAFPDRSRQAAERMLQTIPHVKLIFLLRHPVERLRSHYRHEVQRGRERERLAVAVTRAGNPYVVQSMFYRCLEPYLQLFPREQLCLITTESLVEEPHSGWDEVLAYLGLPHREAPASVQNVTAEKAGYTRAAEFLHRMRVLTRARKLPPSVRALGRRWLLTRDDELYTQLLESSKAPLAAAPLEPIREDLARLADWAGDLAVASTLRNWAGQTW